MATKKRWLVSWGYPDGKIRWHFSDKYPAPNQIDMEKLDARAAVSAHFHPAAIQEVELGLREHLSLRPVDKARINVAAAINAHADLA